MTRTSMRECARATRVCVDGTTASDDCLFAPSML